MKQVIKKQKNTGKQLFPCNYPQNEKQMIQKQQPIKQEQFRRYSQMVGQQTGLLTTKQQNRYSRISNIKSENPIRQRSLTPVSQASSKYISEWQNRYKELESIIKRQHENITHQNAFLQQQIKNLYERQAKHKQTIRRYKQQIKFLRLQNEIYQQRYHEIKTYINSVIQRMSQLSVIAEDDDRELFRTSSLEMVAQLQEELSHYEGYDEEKLEAQNPGVGTNCNKDDHKNVQSRFFVENQLYGKADGRQNLTNHFVHTQPGIQHIVDLQETRFIKDPSKHTLAKGQNQSKKKLYKLPTFNSHPESINISRQSQQIYHHRNPYPTPSLQKQSSTPNSDSKTVENNKTKNFLQDTSESNCQPGITQQIQELTDQSQALMYELQKTNNQDNDIKKKIIRISQKIRELKMEATSMGEQHKFASLQNINSSKQ